VKTVVTLRGGETEHWLEAHPNRTRYVRNVLERADWVTAVAQGLLVQARALVPAIAGKSSVVPNGVVPADLAQRADECRPIAPTEHPYVLFVGRLEAMKDVEVLIDAFAFACTNPTFAHALVIAGSGSLGPALEQRARAVAGDRITFVGSTTYPESLRLIRDAAVLVLPSVSSEGCPNVVLEAMALGTPVVVSDLASLRELVGNGEAGAIFPRGDARALAQRLIETTADASLRDRYVQAARARLDARHRVDEVVAQYERVYERVLV
jgi:phosphatidylinositol alpha-mannosyltransferase